MYRDCEILENKNLFKDVYLLKIKNNFDFQIYPGQFAMIRINNSLDPLLSRPFSFYNASEDSLEFLYQIKGRGTSLLAERRRGEKLKVLAPLGRGFPYPEVSKKIAIIGGGIGIAPLNFLLLELNRGGIKPDIYLGFSTYVPNIILSNFIDNSHSLVITTEDGSLGNRGIITDYIEDLDRYDLIYACGPILMLKKIWEMIEDKGKLYLSLEERMGCGIGICLSCYIGGKDKNMHICKDGPVLSGAEVIL